MAHDILDLKKPFTKLGPDLFDPEFIEQDGIVYAWSEGNARYERAWWLYRDTPDSPLKRELQATRQPPKKAA